MKNLFKKLTCVMVVAFVAVSLFSCALTPQTQLKFTAFPEAEYNVGEVTEAEFLEAVKVELDGQPITLTTLKGLGATITGIHLDKVGTYTLVVVYKGVSIVFEYDVVGLHEASLNGDNYESLVEAFNEAANLEEQAEIILLKNVDLAGKGIVVSEKANVKFNLNGHTVYTLNEGTKGSCLLENKGKLEIVGTGSLTYIAKYPDVNFKDNGYDYPTYASNTITNRGDLTIDGNVVIENQTVGVAVYAIDNYSANLTINNGTVKQTAGCHGIRINDMGGNKTTNVVINDGAVIEGTRAIWVHLASSDIKLAPVMNITINGGEFNCAEGREVIYVYTYGESLENINITVNGGTFNTGSIVLDGASEANLGNCNESKFVVNGGTFAKDVIRYTAEGTVVVYKANK